MTGFMLLATVLRDAVIAAVVVVTGCYLAGHTEDIARSWSDGAEWLAARRLAVYRLRDGLPRWLRRRTRPHGAHRGQRRGRREVAA